MSRANFFILITGTILILGTILTIVLARGYLPDLSTRSLQPTGILVSTSDPDGARVYINGKLTTATNNTLNLAPAEYDIKIERDGYSSWEKRMEIKQEEVIKTNAFLFPKAPDLRPLTLNGAINPTISPDLRKIVYSVASSSAEKNGIWVLDMGSGRPLIGGGGSRQIYRFTNLELGQSRDMKFIWGPDTQQIIVYEEREKISPTLVSSASGNIYQDSLAVNIAFPAALITDSTKFSPSLGTLPANQYATLLRSWASSENEKKQLTLLKLSSPLGNFLRATALQFDLSPDETKVLYTASVAGTLAPIATIYLPGRNPTKETRTVSPGSTYAYDIQEDKNYLISDRNQSKDIVIAWFPSSRHLIWTSATDISAMDFDGTNRSVLYTGPFTKNFVASWPDWTKIVIATSLNSSYGSQNLYSINLR